MPKILPFSLLTQSWRSLKGNWVPIVSTMFAFQLLALVVISPVLGWVFREALRANGMIALDFSAMQFNASLGVTAALIVLLMVLAFWVAALQLIALIVMLRRAHNGESLAPRQVGAEVLGTGKKLLRPSSFALFLYLFILLPITGFGFASVLSNGITIPSFISGELMKSPVSASVFVGFVLVLALLNLRFALALPIFVLTPATGGRAMRQSWRVTRGWVSVKLMLATLSVIAVASVLTLFVVLVAIAPTAVADAFAPDAAPVVAALGLGIAQIMSLLLTSTVLTVLGYVLISLVLMHGDRLAIDLQTAELHQDFLPSKVARRPAALLGVAAVLALLVGFLNIGTMQQLSQHPSTLVLGHRGFSDGGVENTLSGLEAGARSGADLIEVDVMQTADKKFAVIHDASLARLANEQKFVKDLTLDELTKITVHDMFGHEDKIPSLESYIRRAQDLDVKLLIEVKSGGLDSPDRIELLLNELESLGALEQNIFHTLDRPVVQRLKELRPDATVGFILAFAGVDIPHSDADFVVVEEWSATQAMQDAAYRQGLGFFSWTVNDTEGIRELMRRDAEGLITDHPDVALTARTSMQQETGIAGTLVDALTRFVVVF